MNKVDGEYDRIYVEDSLGIRTNLGIILYDRIPDTSQVRVSLLTSYKGVFQYAVRNMPFLSKEVAYGYCVGVLKKRFQRC